MNIRAFSHGARRWKPVLQGRLALAIIAALALFMIAQRPFPAANATETFSPTFTATLSDYGNLKKANITTETTFSAADANLWRNQSYWPEYVRLPRLEVIAYGTSIPIGAKVGTYHDVTTIGVFDELCNNLVTADFDLLNATTDTSSTVSHSAGLADANSNGLPDAVDKYPQTLLNRVSWKPRLRLYGQTTVAGEPWVINVAIFDPEQTGDIYAHTAFIFMDPLDPSTSAPSPFTDFCNPTDATMVNFAVSLDNPSTVANEAGYDVLHNPYLAGAYGIQEILSSFPDADNDGIDNSSDTCPTVPNVGTDADDDGLDAACDPNDSDFNPDQDGDGYLNRQDNCPLVANSTQADADQDGIGTACDTNDSDYGSYASAYPDVYPITITGSSDTDGDGWDNNTETYLGTDPLTKCAANSGANNEGLPDRWPLDFNDTQVANGSDALAEGLAIYNGVFATRNDLYPDGTLDVHDLAAFKAAFGQLCTGSPTAPPTPVDGSAYSYGIDTDATLNDARLSTGFGNGLQHCRSVSGIGTMFDVDVYVNTPASSNPLAGYQFTLGYNPSVIKLQSRDEFQLLVQAAASGLVVNVDDATPNTSGNWTSRVVDLGTPGLEPGGADESGPGVLVRLTFKTIAGGETSLNLQNMQLVTSTNGTAPSTPDWQQQTRIEVDGPCPPNPVITVNDAGTADDMMTGDGVCLTPGSVCTLAAAIDEANADPGADTIHFNIPGVGVHTISEYSGNLFVDNEAATIDATTQPGYAGTPLIELRAPGDDECGCAAIAVGAAGTTIKGFDINGYYEGIEDDAGAIIQGNWIGTDNTGNAAAGNYIGVYLNGDGNVVGGSGAGQGNIISGNTSNGIYVNSNSSGNTIQGNTIGLAANGSALGNGSNGIDFNHASDNTVGGTAAGEGNVISANGGAGVYVFSTCSDGCFYAVHDSIRGNSIYANSGAGIALVGGSNNSMASPAITSSSSDGVSTTISGTLTTPSPETASVDVFSTQPGDPEGRVYLGSATPSTLGAWTLIYTGTPLYGRLTATATKGGDTSEFSSPDVAGPLGPGLPLTTVVRQGDATPLTPTAGTFASFGPAAIPNASGDIVFWASVTSGSASEGIFKNTGGTITTLVASGDAAPVSVGGTFLTFTPSPYMNASGDVVFFASINLGSTSSGIFRRTAGGVITKIAAVGDTSPIGVQTYTNFTLVPPLSFPIINAGGDISFFANLSGGGNGIFLYTGTIAKVVATGDTVPNGGGAFMDLKGIAGITGVPIVSDIGQVSFWGSTSLGPTGVFLWDSGTVSKIAATGDIVPGGGTTYSTFGGIPIANSSGQVVFASTTSAGKTGVYVKSLSGIDRLFQTGDPGPAGVGGTIASVGTPTIAGTGQVTVYVGLTDGAASQAIVRYTNGALENVAAVGNPTSMTPIPGTFSTFIIGAYGATIPTINNYGQVATWGAASAGSGTSGIFITSAPTSVVHLGPVEGAHVPGAGDGTFGNTFDLGLNGNNQAVFTDAVVGGTATQGVFMFFAGNPTSPVQTLALQGPSPFAGDTFATFGPPLNNDNGAVGVHAKLTTGNDEGLYLFFAGSAPQAPQRKARTGGTDGSSGTFSTFGEPSINASGDLAATADLVGGATGLYMFFAGSPEATAAKQLARNGGLDGNGGTYSSFGNPSANLCVSGCGTAGPGAYVAAKSTLSGGINQGLYMFFAGNAANSPPVNVIAKTGGIDGYGSTFTAPVNGGFSDPVINSQNGVVFTADTTDTATHTTTGKGLYMFFAGSPLTKLADLGTDPPSGVTGPFTDFSSPVLGDGTSSTGATVVAHATLFGGGEGLFLFFAGQPVKKIAVPGESPAENGNIHFSGAYPVFPYVAMNTTASIVFVSKITGGPAGSTQGVFFSTLDHDADGVRDAVDNCPNTPNTPQANADGDSAGDQCDNCPAWPNSTQALPNWTVPTGDSECDGFPDSVSIAPPNALASEAHMGTDSASHCAADNIRNNEGPPDRWPVDFDDNQVVNGSDLLMFAPVFGKIQGNAGYDARFDINNDNKINGSDLLKFAPFFGKKCA